MKYVIRSQRDGWYFKEFQEASGPAGFGPIQEAKVYATKKDAQSDLSRMGHYGQRIVAITKIGRRPQGSSKNIQKQL